MVRGPQILLAGALFLCAATAPGADATPRTNWFGDPFFRVSRDIAPCPEPLGPLVTEDEALRQSHHRSERGLRCYLEKRCRYPSAYDYDREIAANIERAAARIVPHPSTLWVLVQGRRVWVYGCVATQYRRGTLERALRAIPDVELALEELRIGANAMPPYRDKD
jgi:hypothetical protein